MSNNITVEVAYALPDRQEILALSVEQGCTAMEAVRQSGIAEHFPELDIENVDMGIFSKVMDGKTLPVPSEYVMEEKDRVEIYRPLLIDPKQARLNRAEKAKKKKEAEEADTSSTKGEAKPARSAKEEIAATAAAEAAETVNTVEKKVKVDDDAKEGRGAPARPDGSNGSAEPE